MNTAEILERAADFIDERGFTGKLYFDDAGRVCVITAVCMAHSGAMFATNKTMPLRWATYNRLRPRPVRHAISYLATLHPLPHSWINRFVTLVVNDWAWGSTHAEAVASMRSAAAIWRAQNLRAVPAELGLDSAPVAKAVPGNQGEHHEILHHQ